MTTSRIPVDITEPIDFGAPARPRLHLNKMDKLIDRLLIEKNQDKITELLHQLTDASYLTLSMISYIKYCSEDTLTKASTDYNHFIKNSAHKPEDLIITLTSLLAMISFAITASNAVGIKKIQTAWKYIREILSGLKNGRNAFVNTNTEITPLLHHHALHYHFVNLMGIGIGAALAPALIHYRYLDTERESDIKHNKTIIENMVHNQYDPKTQQARTQSPAARVYMIGLSFFSGMIDGPYMFGALTLLLGAIAGIGISGVTMGVPVIVFVTLLAAYTLSSVFSAVYAEIEKQKKLQKSADEVAIGKLEYELNSTLTVDIEQKKIELDNLKSQFEIRYHVKPGETKSAVAIKYKMNQLENNILTFAKIDIKDENQENSLCLLLEAERQFICAYPSILITTGNLESIVNEKEKLEEDIKKEKENIASASSQHSVVTTVPLCKSEKLLMMEADLRYINQCELILHYRNTLNLTKNSQEETALALKGYYAELIAAEEKLSERYHCTTNSLKENDDRKCNLNKKIDLLKDKLNTFSRNNPCTYRKYKHLEDQLKLLTSIQTLCLKKEELESKLNEKEIVNLFEEIYREKINHLDTFRPHPPKASIAVRIWQGLRAFFTGVKNIGNTIDGAIQDVVGGIAKPIFKYGVMLPLSFAYGKYLERNKTKELKEKANPPSYTLFSLKKHDKLIVTAKKNSHS